MRLKEYQSGRPIFGQSPAVWTGQFVVFGSEDNRLLAVDIDGFDAWTVVMDAGLAVSPVIGPDGTSYALTTKGTVYAVNLYGEIIWQFANGISFSSTPLVSNNQELYLADDSGRLFALDSQTGQLNWQDKILQSPVVSLSLDTQGRLMATTLTGQMRSLQTASSGLASFGWPKAHGNTQNTGRVES